MWKCEVHNTINMFVIKTVLQSRPRFFFSYSSSYKGFVCNDSCVCFVNKCLFFFFFPFSMAKSPVCLTCTLGEVNSKNRVHGLKPSQGGHVGRKMLTVMGEPREIYWMKEIVKEKRMMWQRGKKNYPKQLLQKKSLVLQKNQTHMWHAVGAVLSS